MVAVAMQMEGETEGASRVDSSSKGTVEKVRAAHFRTIKAQHQRKHQRSANDTSIQQRSKATDPGGTF